MDSKIISNDVEVARLLYEDMGTVFHKISWIGADLHIVIGPDSTRSRMLKQIQLHDMVVEYLIRHAHEDDFDEKYFHKDGAIKYYTVLELAEKEAA